VQCENILQVQKNERRPLNHMKKDTYALWRSLNTLSFEFEYRTIRTIKRYTNCELGWIQVLIVYLSKIPTHS
jgi:uridine phosphorylase